MDFLAYLNSITQIPVGQIKALIRSSNVYCSIGVPLPVLRRFRSIASIDLHLRARHDGTSDIKAERVEQKDGTRCTCASCGAPLRHPKCSKLGFGRAVVDEDGLVALRSNDCQAGGARQCSAGARWRLDLKDCEVTPVEKET